MNPPPITNLVVEKAREDARKIAAVANQYRDKYVTLRNVFLEEVPDRGTDMIHKLDELFDKEKMSKREFIILMNYIRIFLHHEIWSTVYERERKIQDDEIKKKKEIWGDEVFVLVDGLVKKRNNTSFTDEKYYQAILDIAHLLMQILDYISKEKELFQKWLDARVKYFAINSKERQLLQGEWKNILQALTTLLKLVLNGSDYDGVKNALGYAIDKFTQKIEQKKEAIITITIDDDDDDEQ